MNPNLLDEIEAVALRLSDELVWRDYDAMTNLVQLLLDILENAQEEAELNFNED